MNRERPGSPWTEREIEVMLAVYFRMLIWQLQGREFVKSEVRGEIAPQLPARSKKAIELKWCNVSAVLNEMRLPWVDGYRPMPHYQRSLVEAVGSWLDENPEIQRRIEDLK